MLIGGGSHEVVNSFGSKTWTPNLGLNYYEKLKANKLNLMAHVYRSQI